MHVVLLFFFIENHMGANYFRECSLSVYFTAQPVMAPLEETKNKKSANSCIHHINLCQMYALLALIFINRSFYISRFSVFI